MSYGVFRRPIRIRRRNDAIATLTVPAVVAGSLPPVRRRISDSVYLRPYVTFVRRPRSIIGLPNADPVVSLPIVRHRPPYSVYLRPDPPIVRLRRIVIGLPNADQIVSPGSLPIVRHRLPYNVYHRPYRNTILPRRLLIGLPCADEVPSDLISIIIYPDEVPCP